MIHITLTTRNGDRQELDLPVKVADILQRPVPYYLAYGHATVEFETPHQQLNERLNRCVPETIDGGIKELSLLAYILGRMDDQRLELLSQNLPDEPCECTELARRATYFCDWHLTRDGQLRPTVVPLEQFTYPWGRSTLEERLRREFRKELDNQRMTGGQLFEKVMECAKENGDLARFETIGDYSLADSLEKGKLCSYEFDFLPAVSFGGSEGIYIDCSLRGKFDECGRKHIHIGTLKTLSTDLNACKVMGELCGALMYHENKYVNENLYLFDSTESIERMISQKLETEQAMRDNLQPEDSSPGMSGMTM
jgi:hypothetical protein